MNKAERKFSARAREGLAVIFALEKFRVYFLSLNPLKLIIDHQALIYDFHKKISMVYWLYGYHS